MNLYALGLLDTAHAWALALVVGTAFGFWLERAGLGSSRKLSGIFYLTDFAVVQVMLSAVVTAALGLAALDAFGVVEASALHHVEFHLGAQAVGGLIFGIGFVAGGWCPGTALVGLASGKLDALVFLVASMAGALLFAASWEVLAPLRELGVYGVITVPEMLGLSAGAVAATAVLVALAAFGAIHTYSRPR